jgi:hypothetical protein
VETVAMKIVTNYFFPLVTLLLGFLIGHRLNIGRDQRQEFNKAAATFRDTFRHEIAFLRYNTGIQGAQSTDGNIAQFLRTGMVNRHTEALINFRKHLSPLQRRSIDKAWEEYQKQIDDYKPTLMSEKDKKTALEMIETFLDKHAKLK